ncbi:MAG: hypothetical protein RL563_116, partial [Pseudomonadota bacterium]
MNDNTLHFHWLIALVSLLISTDLFAKQAFELMTLRNDGSIANSGLYNSDRPAVSSDGRFVTFRSGAEQLVSPATRQFNIFLRDTQLNTTELISVSSAGVEGNNSSEISDVSDDGCLVVFSSYASNLVDGDTNGTVDIFLRNRCATPATTTRISKRIDGSQTSAGNYNPDITPDGQYIAYGNYEFGVVRYDVKNDITLPLTGDKKEGDQPAISDDGNRVAFYSNRQLIDTDTNNVWDIYLWDATAGLALVSTSSTGTLREQGDESASRIVSPSISGDGRYVSFVTTAANLVAGDTNGFQDVFVKDTQTGLVSLASVTSNGEQGNNDSPQEQGGRAQLSKDGTWITFESSALNLTNGLVP